MLRTVSSLRRAILSLTALTVVSLSFACNNNGNNGVNDQGCETREDCADGQRCTADGVCTDASSACEFASDCGPDEYCAAGTCELAACEDDDGCVDGAICDEGVCREGCRTSDDCPDGLSCTEAKICDQVGCTTDSCPNFQVCNQEMDPPACEYTGSCSSDAQCIAYAQQIGSQDDWYCNTPEETCRIVPPCVNDTECGNREICEPRQSDGKKVCTLGCRDQDGCGPGQICDEAQLKCVQGCSSDSDCAQPGEEWVCVDFVCVEVCESRNDCLMGQACYGDPRTCKGCTDSSQCPATQFCDFEQGTTEEEENNPLIGLCVDLPPSCPEDAYGDNHNQDTAYPVDSVPFETPQDMQPLFCRENGGEWFEISAETGKVVEVELTYDHTKGNLDLGLRREGGQEVVASERPPTIDEGTELLRYGVDLGGTFLVNVRGSIVDQNLPYSLRIDVRDPEPCAADALEPNDEANPATADPGTDYQALEVCGDAPDFYRLSVLDNQVVTISLEAPVRLGNVDMVLRRSQGGQVAIANSGADSERIEVAVDEAGDYFLEVRMATGVGRASYDLEWNQRDNNCADPYEVNNSCPGAPLSAGSYSDLHVCDDSDWYELELLPLQTVTITATYDRSISAGDLDISLFGANDCATLLAAGQETTVAGTNEVQESITYQVEDGGLFNLQVFLFSGIQAGYTLDVDIQDGPACTDDNYEPNNDRASAVSIDASQAATGDDNVVTGLKMCELEEDWFCTDLAEGDKIEWHVSFSQANGDIDAEIVSPTGVPVAVGDSSTDNEVVTYTAAAGEAGEYCLRVFPKHSTRNDYWVITYFNDVGPADPLCPDDYENNDARGEAASIDPGTYGLLVCGNPQDSDWFTTPVQAGETFTVDLAFAHANGNIDLFLYDDTGSNQVVAQSITNTDNESVTYTSARDQDMVWHVRTSTSSDIVPYDMTITRDPAPPCNDDALEPNDMASPATVEAPGLYGRLMLCEDTQDWYAVDLQAGRAAEVFINFSHRRADLDLFVYESDKTTLVQSGESTNDDESVAFTPTTSGTYYVKVQAKGRARLAYDLLLFADEDGNGTLEGPADRSCPDAYEQNDTLNGPASLPVGSYDDLLLCWEGGSANDADYYSVYVPSGATITATINFSHAEGDLQLRLYQGTSTEDTSTGSGDSETVTATNSGAGKDYVVNVFGGAIGFRSYYQLDIELAFAGVCDDDTVAGATQATAGPVTTGTYDMMLCENTEDWMALPASTTSVDVRMELKNRLGNLDLELWEAGGNTPYASSATQENQEMLAVSGLDASTQYYLRVVPQGIVRNAYDLWLSVDGATPSIPWCPDAYERNDDAESADTLPARTQPQYAGMIACGPEDDWHAFSNLLGNRTYSLGLFYNHSAQTDLEFEIVDDTGATLVGPVDTAEDDASVNWQPPSSGTYYFVVRNAGTGQGVYDVLFGQSVYYTSSTSCETLEDAHEPNDNKFNTSPIGFPHHAGHALCGDDDFFQFEAQSNDPVTVELRMDGSHVNTALEVFNTSDLSTVGFDNSNTGNRRSVTFTPTQGENYGIGIVRKKADPNDTDVSRGPYFLHVY